MKPNSKISASPFLYYRFPVDWLNGLFIATALLFMSTSAFSQVQKKLNPKVYEHVIKPTATVEVKTMENGKIEATNTTPIKELLIPADSKRVVPYDKKVSVLDTASYARVKSNTGVIGAREDYKIIPELLIETDGAEPSVFRVVFSVTQPFRYNTDLKSFSATMGFFLLPQSGTNSGNVKEPVIIEVVSNVAKTITPNELNILHLNLPSSKVELMADKVTDSAEVKVITASNPDGYRTYLKVEPRLELLSERSSLQGYGIQTIPVQVRFIGSNSADSTKVNFDVSMGSVTPVSMYVSYNKPSTIYVRSEGTGQVKLSASSSNSDSNEISFTYNFPWPFLLFSMAGGLIGGLVKYYFNAEEKQFPLKHIIGGILIGFIVAVAYYFLGVNLIGLNLNASLNEIAVLGISALGAYFGISVTKEIKN